jgi:hypothetical protein
MNTITPIQALVNDLREQMGIVVPREVLEGALELENESLSLAYKEGAMKYAPNLDVDIIKHIEFDSWCYANDFHQTE